MAVRSASGKGVVILVDRGRRTGSGAEYARSSRTNPSVPRVGTQPQHILRPSSEDFEGRPWTGLSVMSSTPVLKKSRPGVRSGFLPDLANSATASTPFDAISNGNCIEVAPMMPALTFLTPGQPPSTETTKVPLSLPTALSDS